MSIKYCKELLLLTLLNILCINYSLTFAQTTSWTGASSTSWQSNSNWTNGEPDQNTHAIIGDANFTGAYQPELKSSTARCKSLTLGNSTKVCTLEVDRNLVVYGDVLIGGNGSILHTKNKTITLDGDWINNGSYVASNNSATVVFSGSTPTLTGATSFKDFEINAGSVLTLAADIAIGSDARIYGVLNPTANYSVSGSGDLDVERDGKIQVYTANFSGNYSLNVNLDSRSYVEYASSVTTQTVSSAFKYGYLIISGGSTKELAANLPDLWSGRTTEGYIYINEGIFDLKAYTADRDNGSGGEIVIASDAELWIGGTNSFPDNYDNRTISSNSTVYYYGANQTVLDLDYGHLILSGSTGSVVKTMPATQLDIYGSFTLEDGGASSLTITAGNHITVQQEMSIETNCTFNAYSYNHVFYSDFLNDGTFSGGTSTTTFNGVGAELSGSGSTVFNDVIFTKSGIYAAAGTDIEATGDIEIQAAGTFTQSAVGSFTLSGSSKAILGGGFTFYDLIITGSITTAEDIVVAGDFITDGSFTASNNSVSMTGTSAIIDGTGSISFYQLSIDGVVQTAIDFDITSDFTITNVANFTATAGDITFNGNSDMSGIAQLYDVTVNAAKVFNLSANAVLKIANTLTNSGTFNTSTLIPNTVIFNKAANQTVGNANYYNLVLANSGTKTLSADIDVYNDITINSGVSLDAAGYTIALYRHWINSGTFTASSGDVQFVGTNASTLTGATDFATLTVNKTNEDVQVSLENNMTAVNIVMTQGYIETYTNSITTTSGRTGNGIILGTIIHNHSIANGVTYYFEGPNNGLTFYNPSSLNTVSVTVKVGEVANVDPTVESVTREYIVSIPSGTYDSASMRLHYENTELNAFVEPYLGAYKYNSGTNWDSVGYYAKSIADNWVEKGGFTNINGNYMMSGIRNIVRWNGSVSSAWDNPANWTTISGSSMSNRVPDSLDVAQIGEASFTNQPVISTTERINVLRFGSAKAAGLTFSGGSLEVIGSARGNWSSNATHTINVGDDSLTIGTDLTLSDGVNAHQIELYIDDGYAIIGNDLVQTATGLVSFTGSGQLEINHDYHYSNGTFNSGTGTVSYRGGKNQDIAPLDYYNLEIAKSTARARIISPTTVSNDVTTTTGGELGLLDSLSIGRNFTIGTSTEVLEFNSITQIAGDWTNNGVYTVTGGTVIFNGSGNQSVDANTFNNLEVNKSGGVLSLTDDITINNSLHLVNGILDVETYQANRSAEGGNLQIDADATLRIAGANNFPTDFQTVEIDTNSTVEYDGSVAQMVLATTYGNLVFSNGAPNKKTIANSLTVLGDLSINSTAELNPDTTTITLYGNFTNNGAVDPNQSRLILNGTSKTFNGTTDLHNLSVIDGSYTVTTGTVSMSGNLFVESTGSLNFGSNTAILDGDLTNKGSLASNGILTFTGTKLQHISLLSAITGSSTAVINFNGTIAPSINSITAPSFATVNINNTAGITPSMPWSVTVAMNIGSGAVFHGGALTHTIYGDFSNNGTLTSTGKLYFNPGAYSAAADIQLDGTSFSSTGEVEFGGTVPVTLTATAPEFSKLTISNTHSNGITAPTDFSILTDLEIDNGSVFKGGSSTTHTIFGNLTNSGLLDGETSNIVFAGDSCLISGIGHTDFADLTIGDTSYVKLNNDIDVYSNFIIDGEFVANGRTVNFGGSSAGSISGATGSVSFDELTTTKAAGLTTTLSIPVTVNDNLDLVSGTFTTDATNLIIIADSATTNGGNDTSFVIGPLRKVGNQAFVFPLGKGSKWARLGMSAPSSATDAFTAEFFNSAYGNTTSMATSPTPVLTKVSSFEYWTCDRTSGSSNVEVSLYWEHAAQSGITSVTSDLVVARWNGSAWENAGQSAINGAAQGSVTSDAVSSFSPFTFGALNTNVLPVELLEFDGELDANGHTQLHWLTATEINNDYFTVERSRDGVEFEYVNEIKAAGNSQAVLQYSAVDYNPYEGISFYRLKQTDFDGSYTYSELISISNATLKSTVAYPNPTLGKVTIEHALTTKGILRITDAFGKELIKQEISGEKSEINLSEFGAGMYFILLEINGKTEIKTIVKA